MELTVFKFESYKLLLKQLLFKIILSIFILLFKLIILLLFIWFKVLLEFELKFFFEYINCFLLSFIELLLFPDSL